MPTGTSVSVLPPDPWGSPVPIRQWEQEQGAAGTTAQNDRLHLNVEIKEFDAELEPRVRVLAPALLDEPGIGPVNAAEMLCTWSHPGRVRSEAAFAALAGVAPIPHRLARRSATGSIVVVSAGSTALHSAVLIRWARHEETRRYVERRRAEGKAGREIRRCLKRFLARRVFNSAKPNFRGNPERGRTLCAPCPRLPLRDRVPSPSSPPDHPRPLQGVPAAKTARTVRTPLPRTPRGSRRSRGAARQAPKA